MILPGASTDGNRARILTSVLGDKSFGKPDQRNPQGPFEQVLIMRSLEEIEVRIKDVDFDIALIGAGAYGLPLTLYCKSLGKMALQTGGATQTLFGIMGKRWENRPHV